MRPTAFRFLAVISLSLVAAITWGASRPRYGGTLRVESRGGLPSLDPADWPADPELSSLKEKLVALVFDRLVGLDESGRPQPALALAWQQSADGKAWTFTLRSGVKFHNGASLDAAAVVFALRGLHPDWRVSRTDSSVTIASDTALANLPLELAHARNSIFRRDEHGSPIGSGPFRIAEWQPARRLLLVANEDDWGGRPFLDHIEVLMGRTPHDQLIDLELGKADLVELLPSQLRRAPANGARVWSSAPDELFALVFDRNRAAVRDPRIREAITDSVDRAALRDVLLQRQGEPIASLLPEWLGGYAFLFPSAAQPERARQLASQLAPAPAVELVYDSSDPLAQAVADRVAVDAGAAGIRVRATKLGSPGTATPADARLVRVRIGSLDPRGALAGVAGALGIEGGAALPNPATPEQLFTAERDWLGDNWVIPLMAVPEIYGLSARVKDWFAPSAMVGSGWDLEDAWILQEAP
jgi:peptide/nickel transport system substrate-binding protein